MEFVLQDNRIIVCVKPAGILSTDVPGGLPSLVREALGDEKACVRTVHRLDAQVSGLMLLARSKKAASILGQQVMERGFEKEYLTVLHGCPEKREGQLRDFLHRDKASRSSIVVPPDHPDAQEAVLDYRVLAKAEDKSLVCIRLHTGRTHQIRVQFSSRGLPLVGDRKYGRGEDCGIALWSYRLAFDHPESGERVDVALLPPREKYPWNMFELGEN